MKEHERRAAIKRAAELRGCFAALQDAIGASHAGRLPSRAVGAR